MSGAYSGTAVLFLLFGGREGVGKFFAPLAGRDPIDLFENAYIGALVAELQALRDLRDGNADTGQQQHGVTAFAFVDIFHQRLAGVFAKLPTHVALVVAYGIYDLFHAFGHKIFAIEIDEQLRQPQRIFYLRVALVFQNGTQNVRRDHGMHHAKIVVAAGKIVEQRLELIGFAYGERGGKGIPFG